MSWKNYVYKLKTTCFYVECEKTELTQSDCTLNYGKKCNPEKSCQGRHGVILMEEWIIIVLIDAILKVTFDIRKT